MSKINKRIVVIIPEEEYLGILIAHARALIDDTYKIGCDESRLELSFGDDGEVVIVYEEE